jgi:hypothetical protein
MDNEVYDLRKKQDIEKYLEWRKNIPVTVKRFTERDCSEKALDNELFKQFGKTAKWLRRDKDFNIWFAYSHLKTYCGINSVQLDPGVYTERIDLICKMLGV